METFRKTVTVNTSKEGEMIDITGELREAIAASKMSNGLACMFVPHSTAALITIEYEPGLQGDIKKALDRIIPKDTEYGHHLMWGDGNGHSHVRSSFLGASLTVPFHEGEADLGTWQQVVLVELDVRRRDRKVVIQLIGE
ncbi:MAG: secondary thiamine-phosphate synthase enzyme YjbQ [Methanomassiliicoccales archaeon]|nr:secondary thiamine-phosphate synthase enzyme YjbQ [Methanomassiliicoccales archaeon]